MHCLISRNSWHLIRMPPVWSSTVAVLSVAALTIPGLVVPIGGALVGILWLIVRDPELGARLDRARARRAKRRARDDRETRLEDANGRRDDLDRLTAIVDAIERCDPRLAAAHDVEGLLDRYVELAIRVEHYRALLRRNVLWQIEIAARKESLHGEVARRRLEHWRWCRAQLSLAEDELWAMEALVAMLAERAASHLSDALVPPARDRRAAANAMPELASHAARPGNTPSSPGGAR